MPFYDFNDFAEQKLTPHLSSARGPIIEGEYINFCRVSKDPGTGSELHYHPNELMIFPLAGKIHSLVGKDRRIVSPGTFIHVPPYARHQMLATEDGQMDYLYVKDRTWTVVGIAQDEAVPDKAPTVDEVNKEFDSGKYPGQEKEPEKSEAIIEGLNNSYHPIIESLDTPAFSTFNYRWVVGERLAFGFFDLPGDHRENVQENFCALCRPEKTRRKVPGRFYSSEKTRRKIPEPFTVKGKAQEGSCVLAEFYFELSAC